MKRSALRRMKPLRAKKFWNPPRKPLNKRNPKRMAKRMDRYRVYMASPGWKAKRKAAIERAGRQCEHSVTVTTPDGFVGVIRCPAKHRLTVHHLTYIRFGGDEIPEDLQVLCIQHHREAEQAKRGYKDRSYTHRERAA